MTDRKHQIEQLMERLHSLKRLMIPDIQTTAGEECLAPSQWLALHIISRQEGIGIKELAAQLGTTSSAATQLVDGLVKKGLLDRQPSTDDRRALRLSLPDAARQQIETMKEQRLDHLCTLFSALDDAEFQALLSLLSKVILGDTNRKEVA